jgi:hypothetical protein
MLKIAGLFLMAIFPSFGTVITGGFIDLPGGQFEFKSSSFDVFGYIDMTGVTIGNSMTPYASGACPEPLYLPLNGSFGYGSVNDIYYSSLWFNNTGPEAPPAFTLTTPSAFSLSGSNIYGASPIERAPFAISGNLNIFTPAACIECDISLSGSGTTAWTWQYGNIYGGARAVFAFTPAPEPSTWELIAAALLMVFLASRGGLDRAPLWGRANSRSN